MSNDTNAEAISMIRHIVGNHVSTPRLHYAGHPPYMTIDDIREIQTKVSGLLERQLQERGITDAGALDVLAALKSCDWGNQESYESFRQVFDGYVGEEERKVRAIIDELFGKPRS